MGHSTHHWLEAYNFDCYIPPRVSEQEQASGEYTIDQLAAKSGIPSRTIRFYQAKGVLPAPRRRGRVAFYDDSHLERLKVVAELQDKGLRLRAIRDFILTPETTADSVQQWLGLGQQIDRSLADDPQLLSEDELQTLLEGPPPGTIAMLRQAGVITAQGHGLTQRYLVESPALLKIAARLASAGITFETTLRFYEILQKHMMRAADELVEHALRHLGKGFARSTRPEDVAEAVKFLEPDSQAGQATHLIFAREIRRAISEHLKTAPSGR
jgi:DNA-binding transcriptional MerR regulator